MRSNWRHHFSLSFGQVEHAGKVYWNHITSQVTLSLSESMHVYVYISGMGSIVFVNLYPPVKMEIHGFGVRWSLILQTILLLLQVNLLLLFKPSLATRTQYRIHSDGLALLGFKEAISEGTQVSLSSWNKSLHYCKWKGVTCSPRHRHRVAALSLGSAGLAGTISPHIGNLSFLQRIHLPENNLRGSIPPEIGQLSRLRYLNLSYNSLSGTVPVGLSLCLRLSQLDLATNLLAGSIPAELSSLNKHLRLLNLATNKLTGSIPSSLWSLTYLMGLLLSGNSLTGAIPSHAGDLSFLEMLDVSSNNLTGAIPSAIGEMGSLAYLDLSSNGLTGAIPRSVGNLSFLEMLDVSGNRLSGAIPSTISNLSSLIYLNLSNNGLIGAIPYGLNRLALLEDLDISSNKLDGAIPGQSSVGNLPVLETLDISNNSLTGAIPPSLKNLSSLTILDLSDNRFSGVIPHVLGDLTSLTYLNLARNNLEGVIPPSLGNMSSVEDLYLSENRLRGSLPAELGRLAGLQQLRIHNNIIHGALPPSFYNLSALESFHSLYNPLSGTLAANMGNTLSNLRVLNIVGSQIGGPIPMSISNASALQRIDLSDNMFTGQVPPTLGRLRSLEWLNLGKNGLQTGQASGWTFLTSLANCSRLKTLSLSDNNLTGALPSSMANLSTQLTSLNMGRNQISGSIPVGIGNLVNLTLLVLDENLLTGGIPDSIGMLKELHSLAIQGNRFSWQIPASLGNLSKLLELFLDRNNLQGVIPMSLGNLGNLLALDLSQNRLSGSIPKEVLRLPSLARFFDVSQNLLSGPLPREVGQLKNLGDLRLSKNRLSGEIPSSIGDCQLLESLLMEDNIFEGAVPLSLGKLKGLISLDLASNNLSGRFPQFLGRLSSLQYLNLSFNNLEGEVPTEGVLGNASMVSVLGNAQLCGGVTELKLPACPRRAPGKRGKFPALKVIIPTACGVLFLVSASYLLAFHCSTIWKKSRRRMDSSTTPLESKHERVSYTELLRATNGFSSRNLIGKGRFASVYKASLGRSDVAVKVLDLLERGACQSFLDECKVLRNIRHRNLVKVITSCSSVDYRGEDFKAIVLRFMPGGSLEQWLHDAEGGDGCQRKKLGLDGRLNIAIDVASALSYLHNSCDPPIVHCDLKPSNVLLDDDMTAHVGDFGLARFLSGRPVEHPHNISSSGAVKGSIGYIPPEYGMGGRPSRQGDVYSYGILLLELLTGKSPRDEMFRDDLTLHKHVEISSSKGVMEVIDPFLLLGSVDEQELCLIQNTGIQRCLGSIIEEGLLCSKALPGERAEIQDVVVHLHAIREQIRKARANMQRSN